ncbi:suppressor protein SRP40 isoform X1 [Senna tora]|uniref:Suppressor protein SRP40 isoform X1 n=1 Tax=Senna tora TaxID=362788 RepID=A0A835CCI0_9FABA|nr:suppressor protein SRP40 isoform X1 [Senna tora]
MKHGNDNNASSNGTVQLKREDKFLLHNSIAHYLRRCGFSKTLKKFRSEAQIEKDEVEGSSVVLEEMCRQYLELCCKDAKTVIHYKKQHGNQSTKDGEDNLVVDADHVIKKKKKKSDKSDSDALVHQSGTDEKFQDSTNSGEMTNDSDSDSKVKPKEKKDTDKKCKGKKKKSKLPSESLAKSVEDVQLESESTLSEVKLKDGVSVDAETVNGAKTEKKSKDKKKAKKDKPSSDGDTNKLPKGDTNKIAPKKDNSETSNKDVTDKNEDSKKRKRTTSEENDVQLADEKADDEPKRRKVENFNESKEEEQSTKTNGDIDNTNEKSSVRRSQKKQASVEQKAPKAFQRVKIDDVKFADERLQDNSYWAKDGAESGYGAKAEEILGQVRGRGFRHEKTKKKRGSYRGGQIDLESHSIKFNYSDEE